MDRLDDVSTACHVAAGGEWYGQPIPRLDVYPTDSPKRLPEGYEEFAANVHDDC